MSEETYLGDGLYASFDGYQFQLRAPRFGESGDHFCYLEPSVYLEFRRYADNIVRALIDARSNVTGPGPAEQRAQPDEKGNS